MGDSKKVTGKMGVEQSLRCGFQGSINTQDLTWKIELEEQKQEEKIRKRQMGIRKGRVML